jgi:hypothetical protein
MPDVESTTPVITNEQTVTVMIPSNGTSSAMGVPSEQIPTTPTAEGEIVETVIAPPVPEFTDNSEGAGTGGIIPIQYVMTPTGLLIEYEGEKPTDEEIRELLDSRPGTGRPCKYCSNKEEYQKLTEEYIAKHTKGEKPGIPFIEELALLFNTIEETVMEWAQKKRKDGSLEHPEFSDSFAQIKMIQKLRLQQRALGRYQPLGALTLLRFNHGAVETSKQIIAGDKNEPLQVEIIEEQVKQTNE